MADDPNATQPPARQPNTLRTWIPRIVAAVRAFAASHPDWMIVLVIIAFAAGAILL